MSIIAVLRRSNHFVLRNLPDGLPLPILSGYLRGYWFELHKPHYGYITGRYEKHIQDAIRVHLHTGQTFWDLGAHLGFHTLLGCKRVGPHGRVFALEPRYSNYRILRRILQRNDIPWCFAFPEAVSDKNGTEEWHEVPNKTMWAKLSAATGHPEWIDSEPHETKLIKTYTLDTFLRWSSTPPDLIKMDIEGAESRALLGAEKVLQHGPRIILSTHGIRQLIACSEILRDHGYTVCPIHGDDVLFCYKTGPHPDVSFYYKK